MRALVTGSTGFLGSTLMAELRERGIDVLGLRRSTSPNDAVADLSATFVVGDIQDLASLRRAMEGVDWVFHVAAVADYRHNAADVLYRANVDGARNVFQAALEAGVRRLVFTGSTGALGVPQPGKPLLDEQDTFNLRPEQFPYGHSKHLAEQVLREYVEQGLDAVTVLPSPVMGPRDLRFIAGELIIQALKGGIPVVPRGGLNFIDVRDCMQGHIAAAERGRTGERYLLAGSNMTHRQVMNILHEELGARLPWFDLPSWSLPLLAGSVGILRRLGLNLPIDSDTLLLGSYYLYYDNSKAVRELGLKSRPFAESVRDAYEWYREHGYLERRGILVSEIQPTSGA